MPVPTYDQFIEPIFRYLSQNPDGVNARNAYEAAADMLGLSDADRAELLPSGVQPIYKNRAGWAHDRLKRAGYSSSLKRGFWQLTSKGLDFIRQHDGPFSTEEVYALAQGNKHVQLRPKDHQDKTIPLQTSAQSPSLPEDSISPDERLESAFEELLDSVASELLEAIGQSSPTFFEVLVLDLLHSMGYGASRQDIHHVGGSGDGGIDGVISLDRLGLEKVYVQAKRWQNVVGRPDVQAFYGALAGQRATKGVFITTSRFTDHAIQFSQSVDGVILVDGTRLAKLMIEYGIGVSHRLLKLPKLDSDYFEE